MGIFLPADAPLAAVAGNELTPSREFVDGETAAVDAAAALCHAGLILQAAELFVGEHAGLESGLEALPGDEGSAEGTHDARDIGADGLAVSDFLEAPQDGVIVEGAALHYDVFAQLRGVGHLDHLEQGIFDHGVGESRGDVRNPRALFLGLFHPGVHEYGAAGAQVNGMLGKNRRLRKVFHAVVQGFGKGLNERTAAGRAGLVQQHAVHGVVLDLDAFHVLSADIQDAVHLRVKEGCGIIMGHGLHLAIVQQKSGLHQGLAVACGAGADDADIGRQQLMDLFQGADGSLQRTAVIVAVEGVEQGAVLAHQSDLRGGGAGVYP